jgi:flavin-binding protein dodecin
LDEHLEFLEKAATNGTIEAKDIENKMKWFETMETHKQNTLYV